MNLQLFKNSAPLILIFLFIFTRLLLIYVSDDFYDPEACGIGNVANEILDGLKQPYYLYQHQDNYGNTLVTPFLVMFLFILFGKTSLSLLLAGIIINVLILTVLYLLLEKFFDKTAAIYASLLFIFSPI